MIRLMQAADLSQVAQIENLVQTHPWSLQQFQESMQSYHSTVIEQAGQVVGFCILQPVLDEANLLLMAIHPSQQGKGLGYQLLDASLAQLKNNPIQVFLEVRESNQQPLPCMKSPVFIKLICVKTIILNQMVVVSMPLLW
jgi:ribosomal-protein-alanine N-acetyltransferase